MKILAITACTAGIAHTYIAKEKLENAAKELGHFIKSPTQCDAQLPESNFQTRSRECLNIQKRGGFMAKKQTFMKHIMTSISYMIPIVVAGGILGALAKAFGGWDIGSAISGGATPFSNLNPFTWIGFWWGSRKRENPLCDKAKAHGKRCFSSLKFRSCKLVFPDHGGYEQADMEEMIPVVKELAARVHVPVALNLDHGIFIKEKESQPAGVEEG